MDRASRPKPRLACARSIATSTSSIGAGHAALSARRRRCAPPWSTSLRGAAARPIVTSPRDGSRITQCTMPRRGNSSSICSSTRANTARAGWIPGSFSLRRPHSARLYFAGFAGGEVADLLTVRDLRVYLDVDAGTVKAVDGVSFRVPEGGTVALVGESGSGKSVVAQTIMSILPRIAHIESGEILFRDPKLPGSVVDLSRLNPQGDQMRQIRGGRISIIFQEPMTALSPLHTIGDQVGETLALHRPGISRAERHAAVLEILRLVGFPNPVKAERTYPFELSGGLRQRAMIATALICRPALLIADEPTTALDVTIQAQILQLIRDLQRELGMAVLLITHDLGVVANMAAEVVVMYRGRVMEAGRIEDIFRESQHPYLQALMRAVPRFNMAPGERLTPIREVLVTEDHLIATRENYSAPHEGTLLQVQHLTKRFTVRKRAFTRKREEELVAVDDVSFTVATGECL